MPPAANPYRLALAKALVALSAAGDALARERAKWTGTDATTEARDLVHRTLSEIAAEAGMDHVEARQILGRAAERQEG